MHHYSLWFTNQSYHLPCKVSRSVQTGFARRNCILSLDSGFFHPWTPSRLLAFSVPMLILQTQSTKRKLNEPSPHPSFLSFSLLLILICAMIKKKQKRPSNLLSNGFQRARLNWIDANQLWWAVCHPLCKHPPK